MLFAILAHVGKFNIWGDESDWCCCVDNDFEDVALQSWNNEFSGFLTRRQFIQSYGDCLRLFLSPDVALRVDSAVTDGGDYDVEDVRVLSCSVIGEALFATEVGSLTKDDFIGLGKERVQQLEYNDFPHADMAAFDDLAGRQVWGLKEKGFAVFGPMKVKCGFLGMKSDCKGTSMGDHWMWGRAVRIKEFCVSYELDPRFPWELLEYPTGQKIEFLPKTVKLPEDL